MSEPTSLEPTLKKGTTVEVLIEGLDPRGSPFGTSGGSRVVFRRGIPGSRVLARIVRRRKGRVEARLEEVLEPSPGAVPARCPHVGSCGGCSFQDLEYSYQLEEKQRQAERILGAHEALRDLPIEPVLPSPRVFGYRNKMDFTFSGRRYIEEGEPEDVESDFALGLHPRGLFSKVIDLRECHIHFPEGNAILESARRIARSMELVPWILGLHTGLLRHLVLRKSFAKGEILALLITSSETPELVEPYVAALCGERPEITTFIWGVSDRRADVAAADEVRVLHGTGEIEEELGGLRFAISPQTFFQTNTDQAEHLIGMVLDAVGDAGEGLVYDLYSGCGAITLALAARAESVVGFEFSEAAVADAFANAKRNVIDNVDFIAGDVAQTLRERSGDRPTVCVVDPPRAGLHPKVVASLLELAPGLIVYVSCNLRSAAENLVELLEGGYRVDRIQPLDMFPHTPHLESVIRLERRDDAPALAGPDG